MDNLNLVKENDFVYLVVDVVPSLDKKPFVLFKNKEDALNHTKKITSSDTHIVLEFDTLDSNYCYVVFSNKYWDENKLTVDIKELNQFNYM